jgi:hypothetical protein
MPPRTTRKSYGPRVPDRTMVGTSPPRCLPASETDGVVNHNRMNLPRTRTPRASQHEMGWKAPRKFLLLPVAGEFSLLTFPLYRTGLSSTDSHMTIRRVVSRGRRNTGSKSTRRSFKTQGLSRPLIQTQGYFVQVRLREARQIGFLGQVLS